MLLGAAQANPSPPTREQKAPQHGTGGLWMCWWRKRWVAAQQSKRERQREEARAPKLAWLQNSTNRSYAFDKARISTTTAFDGKVTLSYQFTNDKNLWTRGFKAIGRETREHWPDKGPKTIGRKKTRARQHTRNTHTPKSPQKRSPDKHKHKPRVIIIPSGHRHAHSLNPSISCVRPLALDPNVTSNSTRPLPARPAQEEGRPRPTAGFASFSFGGRRVTVVGHVEGVAGDVVELWCGGRGG